MAERIYGEFGLNQRELHDQASNTWKMIWEQLLLVALYARQRYLKNPDEAENFQQRIKMIHLLCCEYDKYKKSYLSLDRDIPDIFGHILDLLEDECGSTKIIEFLLVEEVSSLETSKKRILRKMEEAKIAFSPMPPDYKRDYSYYSLYQILNDPIFFISELLSIAVPDHQTIKNTIINSVYSHLCEEKRFLMKIRTGNSFENFRNKPLQEKERLIFENISFIKNKDSIKQLIQGQIAELIGKNVQRAFNLLCDPFFSKDSQQNELFKSILEIDSNVDVDNLNIRLNKKAFVNLMNLNQLDELVSVIKKELKKEVLNKNKMARQFGIDIDSKLDQASTLEKISAWYDKSNTGLFSRFDQIPKIIVSILEFDIRYFKGIFDPDLGFNTKLLTKNQKPYSQLQAKDIYLLVSVYIRNYLYYDDKRRERNSVNGLLLDQLVNRDLSKTSFHRNRMMEVWSTFEDSSENPNEHRKMMDRFKRMPQYLNVKDPKMVDDLIKEQKDKGNNESAPPYPLNSFFPLPLWSSRFTKSVTNEEIPQNLS